MSGPHEGWFRIQLGSLDQGIALLPRARHSAVGYFMCPARNRPVSVLWKPNGATRFCSRQAWGRQVAYQSQFNDTTNRAHAGKARINGVVGAFVGTAFYRMSVLPSLGPMSPFDPGCVKTQKSKRDEE
jgi:hypothetical protein